jgi:hypothetical protein
MDRVHIPDHRDPASGEKDIGEKKSDSRGTNTNSDVSEITGLIFSAFVDWICAACI